MADNGGSTFGGTGGAQHGVGGSIGGGDDIIRIDPGVIDAAAETGNPSVGSRPGYGPNGRKLRKDGTERAAKGSGRNSGGTTQTQASLPVEALAASIMGMHALLSSALHIPELMIDPKESQQLAAALANLQRFYPVVVTEKALAWGQVFSALGIVYGTRFAAFRMRKIAEKKTNPQGADVIRPQQFQRPHVTPPPPPASPIQTPDGDPIEPPPRGSGARTNGHADQVFSNTPPELI